METLITISPILVMAGVAFLFLRGGMKTAERNEELSEIAKSAISCERVSLLRYPESASVSGWDGFCDWSDVPIPLKSMFEVGDDTSGLVLGFFFDWDMCCPTAEKLNEYLVGFLREKEGETGFMIHSLQILDDGRESHEIMDKCLEFPLMDEPEFIHLVLFHGSFSELPEKLRMSILISKNSSGSDVLLLGDLPFTADEICPKD